MQREGNCMPISQKSKAAQMGCQVRIPATVQNRPAYRGLAVSHLIETLGRRLSEQPLQFANRSPRPEIALANRLTRLPYLLHLNLMPAHAPARDSLPGHGADHSRFLSTKQLFRDARGFSWRQK